MPDELDAAQACHRPWMALVACNDLLREARETGFAQPEGWTIEKLEHLIDNLMRQYVEETGGFADPRGFA